MDKTCQNCGQPFNITKDDSDLLNEISPLIGGKKYNLLLPTLCPACRLQRRMTWRNERKLYHCKSVLSGKQIVSMYAPEKNIPVVDQTEWWGDKWNPHVYGVDMDFTRSFFTQFNELQKQVPHQSLFTKNVENSYYTNYTLNLKNCYLIFGGGNLEDCFYGKFISGRRCNDVVDSFSIYDCQWCYEGVASENCYNCLFFTNCRNCQNCLMVEDCQSCKNCLLCFGLSNQEYCILNKKVSKDQYEAKLKDLMPLTTQKIRLLWNQLSQLKKDLPHRACHIYGSENCSGDMIFNSKQCYDSFDIRECEACRYVSNVPLSHYSMDGTFGAPDGIRYCYETCSSCGSEKSVCTFICWNCSDMFYCSECGSCQNCFGCIGLQQKQYCILNKQYEPQQYYELVGRIIEKMRNEGQWGEFFPASMSLFGYNETIAAEYFPLEKNAVVSKGWPWFEEPEKKDSYLGPKTPVPSDLLQVDDSVCQQIFSCKNTGKPYKIIPQELKFYRQMGLPLPELCPDERHRLRMIRKNPYRIWERKCDKCDKIIRTNYAPERKEKIWCEECYLGT